MQRFTSYLPVDKKEQKEKSLHLLYKRNEKKTAVNKTRIGLLGSDRIGLRIGSDRISDRTSIFTFGAEELF